MVIMIILFYSTVLVPISVRTRFNAKNSFEFLTEFAPRIQKLSASMKIFYGNDPLPPMNLTLLSLWDVWRMSKYWS